MVNRKVNHKVKRVVNRQTKPASNRYLSSREVGMVSVETALSIGPLIAVVGLLLMPLFGWIYAADAGNSAREIAREYAIHHDAAARISRAESEGKVVRIRQDGNYIDVTVTRKLPAAMSWLGVNLSGSHRMMVEPNEY